MRTLAVATMLALLSAGCSQDLAEEKAREAAEKAQAGLQPIDAGAMEQDVDAETVTRVQEQLTAIKEYMGPITGKLDPVTINAFEAFQRSIDLTPDGRFEPSTLEALERAAQARS